MKVGIFTDTYKPQINGVVTSVALMEQKLRENGHQPYIFTISHPAVDPKSEPDNIIRIRSFKFYGNQDHRIGLLYSPVAIRKAKELGIELVHSHAPFSLGIFGHYTARRLRIPEVHTYHTMLEDYVHYIKLRRLSPARVARQYSKVFCNLVNGVIVPTEKVRDKLLSYGVRKPIHVLPTGIELNLFQQPVPTNELKVIRENLGLSPEDLVLLFVGRIAKEKNIDALIQYHRTLVDGNPRYKLVIVGSGDYQPDLERQVAGLSLQSHVVFAGKRDYQQLPGYYQMADCFVIASTSETQGLVVAEAMASGLPVVAVNDESFHPMVRPEYNGFFFTSQQQYVDQITKMFTTPSLRKTLAKNSQELSNEFSAEAFYQKLIAIYQEVLYTHRANQQIPTVEV